MSVRSIGDWDLVGIAVNILVAVLLIGGLLTYAAAGPAQLAPDPSGTSGASAAMQDVDKRSEGSDSLAFDEPVRDVVDEEGDDEERREDTDDEDEEGEDDEDGNEGHGNGHGHGKGKD